MSDLTTLSDRDLFLHGYNPDAWDLPTPDGFDAEIDRRFGQDATERLGQWFTATHASPNDQAMWARGHSERLAEIARGHTCDNDSLAVVQRGEREQGLCWCGHFWHKLPGDQSWREGPAA